MKQLVAKAIKALANLPSVEHKHPILNKEDLERKFVVKVDRKGKIAMKEIKD